MTAPYDDSAYLDHDGNCTAYDPDKLPAWMVDIGHLVLWAAFIAVAVAMVAMFAAMCWNAVAIYRRPRPAPRPTIYARTDALPADLPTDAHRPM